MEKGRKLSEKAYGPFKVFICQPKNGQSTKAMSILIGPSFVTTATSPDVA